MDTTVARLEAEITGLRADVARANRELHALRDDVQSMKTELTCASLRALGRKDADDFRAIVITLIVITFVLFAAMWRSLGQT
jgi:hypothetical protein